MSKLSSRVELLKALLEEQKGNDARTEVLQEMLAEEEVKLNARLSNMHGSPCNTAEYDDMKSKFGLTNFEIAAYVNNLPEDDFFEVMLQLGWQNGCKDAASAIVWLNDVMWEIKQIKDERGDEYEP